MTSTRLRFALEQLAGGDWLLFERFTSEFLAPEFPAFRTTATPSGDRGRDGEIFSISGAPNTGFQFSVTAEWKSKISDTLKTLDKNGISYRRIVYCTNRQIGAAADDLKAQIWDDRAILLDIRDREWFCERELTSAERATASEELAEQIVTPIVTARGIASVTGAALSSDEARVALVHLTLNANDRIGDSNLTKTSLDALVQSVLVDTSQEQRLEEAQIVERMYALLPHAGPSQVAALTRSSLIRLSRKNGPVKSHSTLGGYHMSHSAAEAWKDAAASYVLDQQSLEADLAAAAYGYDGALDDDYGKLRSEAHELRIALESVMLRAGESFVAAVEGGEPAYLSAEQLEEQVIALDLPLRLHPKQAAAVILEVLSMPADQTRQHLTRVLDAYTLFSFLQQTPDVQKALSRVFTNAKIWLDTSTVLPLVAESLIDDENKRLETALLSAASDSGVGLYVTDGVIEELRYHIEKCINYVRQSLRDGEPPFLYAAYMLSGRDERQFAAWTADIHGSVHPDLDIEDYLYTKFQIVRKDLAEVAAKADPKLRAAVTKLFQEKHNRSHNRQDGRLRSPTIINRLVSHDVESVVGVIELRRDSRPELGYEAWWLTLDKTAYRLKRWLSDNLGKGAPDTPALSPDYLSQLLRLGPLRRSLRSEDAQNLPLIIDVTRLESVPSELIEVARNTRLSLEGLDERRIRREVRDALHRAHTTLRSNHDYGSAAQSSVARRLTAQRNK